mmetsp:Transcript_7689/g.18769  ORF Transcript_7689/g.18769 Transcript_7689/m.18769 type:complete len:157 (-) Transcript_7689:221-691(-)
MWAQSIDEVELFIKIPDGADASKAFVHSRPDTLKVGFGDNTIINGTLFERVKSGETCWSIEDGNTLHITLSKLQQDSWWKRVIDTDPSINPKKCVPAESRLSELEPSMQTEVEKMLWKQRMKAKGMPTEEEIKKKKILEEFSKRHPEFDISKADCS